MTTHSPSRDGAFRTRPTGSATTQASRRLVRPGLAAAVVATAATTLVAALAEATVVDLEVPPGEESIPPYVFALLTFVFSTIGVAIAAWLRRWSERPATVFVRTSVTLTLVSLVPPFLLDADPSTEVTLVLAHLVAAAIVIPVLALRLAD